MLIKLVFFIVIIVFFALFLVVVIFVIHFCHKTALLHNRNAAKNQKHCEIRKVVVVVVKAVPALDELTPKDVSWGEQGNCEFNLSFIDEEVLEHQ